MPLSCDPDDAPPHPQNISLVAPSTISEPPITYTPPTSPYLPVLYFDDDLLIISKPSGLLSVPGRGPALADCVATRAENLFAGALIVHRLDMDTSGIMALARTRAAQRHLSRQFENRQIGKAYIARVLGKIEADAGEINAPLICDWPNRPRQVIDHQNGKSAETSWQVIHREANATRVRLMPTTGRSHQLRVHMASLGHCILGDNLYADAEALAAADRLQLHAQSLTLTHPTTGDELSFEDVCPF